jgi:ubiquinone/menaquinone biosynthesis C-methylase UbiE
MIGKNLFFNRRFTSKINWIFDNLLPPILRDSRIFMWPLFRLVLGTQMKHFMFFKEKAWNMTAEEYTGTYDLLAESHIERETDLNQECIDRIIKAVVGARILDIACGRGYLARKIAECSPVSVVGVDINPPHSASTEQIAFVKGAVEGIPFPDKYFDTVVSTHTLEHVRKIDDAIRELRRVAKKRLILVVPKQREYCYTFDLHLTFFPYEYRLRQIMNNESASVSVVGGDFLYIEDVERQ